MNGLQLHHLDWAGQGDTLLFLPGLGHFAHIYDDLAPRFADRFRVLGLTRRGHGASDQPESGYDTETLIEDLRQLLDQREIQRACLVGHSFAGTELTHFAAVYPQRISTLVYLDAAYDYSTAEFRTSLPVSFEPSANDLASFDTLRAYLRTLRNFGSEPSTWSAADEANMRETWIVGGGGEMEYRMPAAVCDALVSGMQAAIPDYSKVSAPALAFYVIWRQPPWLSFCADDAARNRALSWYDQYNRWKRAQIERFRYEMSHARVIEMPETDHHLFLHRPDEVVQEMGEFLQTLQTSPGRLLDAPEGRSEGLR